MPYRILAWVATAALIAYVLFLCAIALKGQERTEYTRLEYLSWSIESHVLN